MRETTNGCFINLGGSDRTTLWKSSLSALKAAPIHSDRLTVVGWIVRGPTRVLPQIDDQTEHRRKKLASKNSVLKARKNFHDADEVNPLSLCQSCCHLVVQLDSPRSLSLRSELALTSGNSSAKWNSVSQTPSAFGADEGRCAVRQGPPQVITLLS